jgi:hypothetical protein
MPPGARQLVALRQPQRDAVGIEGFGAQAQRLHPGREVGGQGRLQLVEGHCPIVITALGLEAGAAQRLQHRLDVLRPAGLDHQFDLHVLRRQHGEGALVVHLVDVGAGLGHGGRDARQRPGHVARADAHPRQPPVAHHAALDDRGQQQRVDVAAAQHQPDGAAGEARLVLHQRRQPGRAGAFDQRLLDLQQHHDGCLDVALVDQHHVVQVRSGSRPVTLPGVPTAMPSAMAQPPCGRWRA